MALAVLALAFGQVAAMPVVTASSHDDAAYHTATSMQTELGKQEPCVPCHHHGNAQGALCCSGGDCPMLVLALPASTPAVHPMIRQKLAYRHDAVHPPPGTDAVPLLPPPRSLV